MSGGEIAALIAAAAFVLLVGLLAVPILKLGRTLDETTRLVASVNERTAPLLGDVGQTVRDVNGQLERVDVITANTQAVTNNVAALTSLFAATLGGPVVRVAAFTYGIRHAITGRRRSETAKRVRQEMRTERRGRRFRRGGRGAHAGGED